MKVLLETARKILLEQEFGYKTDRVPLQNCYKRILAEDIVSDMDFPPFNRSPLDGYAVRMADIRRATPENPVFLNQIDYIPAGALPSKTVTAGEATRIMTGAPIPDGADAVVRLEDTCVRNGLIGIMHPDMAAQNICSKGEEISSGETVLSKGTCLEEGALALLAMLGHPSPLVYEMPKVGILATGSELVSVSDTLEPGKIRDSNSYMLFARVCKAGGAPVLLGHVKDDINVMIQKLHDNPGLPVYITTGGASVGDYDLMEELFKRMQIPILFERVAIKPGMPILAGLWNGSLLIALSGNPAACSVSFEVLLRPLLRKLAGYKILEYPRMKVRLAGEFKKTSPVRRFVWARWFVQEGMFFAEPVGYQGNGMIKSTLKANVLLDIPANSKALLNGAELEALILS
ncbi:molybdopterin molybdotransferase MoeA [Sporomusa sphaeroides]|uniref:molybdopterin molybdotransferase MoeA n=1 Tax=Sporomusa sphaeroides TaxID=47679 RepID=UPI002BD6F37C|nr:gephyrin-like molybdotransferase Glp [Sporomusa sphaeroides]HML32003.1 molybdopterin molybdotransferase MoeA [Sporomusa sphaeroides]